MSREPDRSPALPIGALARASGVKATTIRFYEEIGLMPPAARSAGDRRLYGADALARLRFIRHARQLGFEIADIRGLLDLAGRPEAPCAQADAIARHHLEAVDLRLAALSALRGELARMIEACGHGRIGDCRIIESLAGDCRAHPHTGSPTSAFTSSITG